ncbi:11471_t:CDS:2, partial [Funneliformis geosporum]
SIINRITEAEINCGKNEVLVELANKHCACSQMDPSNHAKCLSCRHSLPKYLPLCNPAKYEHIYDRKTGLITVKNIRQDRVVGVFDYPELCEYMVVQSN